MTTTTTTTIDHPQHVLELREFTEVANDVCPLTLHRDPKFYVHSTCVFEVSKEHPEYGSLRRLIENWYSKVPQGDTVVVDLFDKHKFADELERRKWYVLDLRAKPDTWPNQIVLKHFEGNNNNFVELIVAQKIYDASKSLVVFTDHLDKVPKCWKAFALWALTEKRTAYDLRQICMQGTQHTPMDIEVFRGHSKQFEDRRLLGYQKFNAMPEYVYWPVSS